MALSNFSRLEAGSTDRVLRSNDRGYEVRMTEVAGEGVFAVRHFAPGETVVHGRIKERLGEKNSAHASQVGKNDFVLLADMGPKVNHSCDPNCGVRLNSEGAYDLIARRAIAPEDEISFDYAMRNFRIEHFPTKCLCGSKNCRGSVTGWQSLPEHRRLEYRGLVAPYLLEIDAD